MKLHNLKAKPGARSKKRYRVGRGMAQGRGKQAGKGQSGQNKRHGHRPGFEGGQNPWFRRLPKRGFININHVAYQLVSLAQLEAKYHAGAQVDCGSLLAKQLISHKHFPVKVLANGKVTKKLQLVVHAISKPAQVAIAKAGGTISLIKPGQPK